MGCQDSHASPTLSCPTKVLNLYSTLVGSCCNIKTRWFSIKIVKTYRYKLYNNKKNKILNNKIDIAGYIWNYCIAVHRIYYKLYKKHLPLYDLQKHITKLKKKPKYSYWCQLGSQAIQDVTERVEHSYKAFFEHIKENKPSKKSIPKFKKVSKYSSFTLKQKGYRFYDDNTVTIMKKKYKYFKNREIQGEIKTVTVKRNKLGDFYISVVTEQEVPRVNSRADNAVGIDFGMKHFLNLDDYSVIDSPEYYKQNLTKLKNAHRKVSRCKLESNNRKRAIKELDRIYRKISNSRKDWFYKLANSLTKQYSVICIEDLNLEAMKKLWGRKISDLSYGEFVQILEWEALKNGSKVVKIDRFAPSSKACHCCGFINDELTLKDRSWTCPSCGEHLDRDVNAAINIRNLGLSKLNCK